MNADPLELEFDTYQARSRQATAAGGQAFARLLALAEERDSGQIRRVGRFIAAVFNGETFPLDPFELRAVDVAISDDMLCFLDGMRAMNPVLEAGSRD